MPDLAKLLILVGALMVALGAVSWWAGLAWLGRLPGDLVFRRGSLTIYLPLASCLAVSAAMSLVLLVLRRSLR